MATLLSIQGPTPEGGKRYPLRESCTVLGRQLDSTVCLTSKAVSRQHAQIHVQDGKFLIEDLDSSNGTYLNSKRLSPHTRVLFTENDTVQVGPYTLLLLMEPTVASTEPSLIIKTQVNARGYDQSVYEQAPEKKLQVVLEISRQLARTLEIDQLLHKLLEQLITLFPQADRAMYLACEGDKLVVRAQKLRHRGDDTACPYSRTVVKRALEEGVGILSEDVQADQRFESSATLTSMDLHSLLCVPLITQEGKRLGILQVDRFRRGAPFNKDDLELLTTVALQVVTTLENAALHAEVLHEQRRRQELELAREIQLGFLPSDFEEFCTDGIEVFGSVQPASDVAGDLYDVQWLADGRLSLFVGDVMGKGMPAALFMVAVRTLCRHIAAGSQSPAKTLEQIHESLAKDNPQGVFVTLAHAIYDLKNGQVVLSSGGHPMPLLRRADGRLEELPLRTGRMLGIDGLEPKVVDTHFQLGKGDLATFYTDGLSEARVPGTKVLFGEKELPVLVKGFHSGLSLPTCVDHARKAVHRYTGLKDLQDDLTMFLLRRHG